MTAETEMAHEPAAELSDPRQQLRIVEAVLFASSEPVEEAALAERLPGGADLASILNELAALYENRGMHLVKVGKGWAFRTAADLSPFLQVETKVARNLSPAMTETLATVAYHQPVTRAEIEDIRGVQTAAGTLDVLLKTGWIRPRGRRKAPGRPITYGTTEAFLMNFGLEEVGDLPGLEELKGAGLIEGSLPTGFNVPMPSDDSTLRDDEEPLDPGDLDLALAPSAEPEASTAEPEAAAPEAAEGDKDAG